MELALMTAYDVEDRLGAAQDLAPISHGGSGQLVTITTPGTAGTYDPMTDTTSGATAPSTQIGSGVEETASAYSVANGLAQAGDIKFLLSALQFTSAGAITSTAMTAPVADRDTLTKADGVWAIKQVDAISPAGLPIIWTLRLRKGA